MRSRHCHLGLFDDRRCDRFQGLQILTNHQRGGGAFARRADELLAAAHASITCCEYAWLTRFQSRPGADEASRVEIDYPPNKLGIGFETHEHEYRSKRKVFVRASPEILQYDAAEPAVTSEFLQDGIRSYRDLRVAQHFGACKLAREKCISLATLAKFCASG